MEGYGVVLVVLVILATLTGLLVSWITNLRGLPAAAFGIALVFALTLLGWHSVELALFATLIAILPALAGAGLGAVIRNRRNSE